MSSIIDSITSQIPNPIPDALNPFAGETSMFALHPRATDPDTCTDLIWLLDNTAAEDPNQASTWRASMVAAFFGANTGKSGQKIVGNIVGQLQDAGVISSEGTDADEQRKRVEERTLPFFREVVEGRTADVRMRRVAPRTGPTSAPSATGAAVAEQSIGPSNADGVAQDDIVINGQFTDGELTQADVARGVGYVPAYTTYAGPEGWAIISDIDDTIKVTLTDQATGTLQSTFLDEPKPIEGMPEFYWHMNNTLNNPPFWYLSASPYNLYEFLHKFRDTYYPRGTIELRNASWRNTMNFISSLRTGTKKYKVDKMEDRIHKWWPNRKFICVGDSTQSDPEAYGEIARRHPGWVAKILIRRVKNVVEPGDGILPGKSEEERNNDERFEKAFDGLDRNLWYVFDTPQEAQAQFDAMVQTAGPK